MTAVACAAVVLLAALLGSLARPPHEGHPMPAPLRRLLDRLTRTAADDPQRSPDWCWTHQCHRNACPKPH